MKINNFYTAQDYENTAINNDRNQENTLKNLSNSFKKKIQKL